MVKHTGMRMTWSPHENASTREKAFLSVEIPKPAFGIQMINTDRR
ncbi:hypothetical protein ACFLRO_02440 [Bacteroidota bacterium]